MTDSIANDAGWKVLLRRVLPFAALLLWCAVLIFARWWWTGARWFGFLGWNLILATIPALAGLGLERELRERPRLGRSIAWAALWMLFLPNAPYIVTDLIHLEARSLAPFWYDILIFVSCAGTGVLLAFGSVAGVQGAVERRFGAAMSWCVAVGALFLSAFGVYLGRFMRWNSWDAVFAPARILGGIAARVTDPFSHPRTLAITLLYGTALVLGYLAVRTIPAAVPARIPRTNM